MFSICTILFFVSLSNIADAGNPQCCECTGFRNPGETFYSPSGTCSPCGGLATTETPPADCTSEKLSEIKKTGTRPEVIKFKNNCSKKCMETSELFKSMSFEPLKSIMFGKPDPGIASNFCGPYCKKTGCSWADEHKCSWNPLAVFGPRAGDDGTIGNACCCYFADHANPACGSKLERQTQLECDCFKHQSGQDPRKSPAENAGWREPQRGKCWVNNDGPLKELTWKTQKASGWLPQWMFYTKEEEGFQTYSCKENGKPPQGKPFPYDCTLIENTDYHETNVYERQEKLTTHWFTMETGGTCNPDRSGAPAGVQVAAGVLADTSSESTDPKVEWILLGAFAATIFGLARACSYRKTEDHRLYDALAEDGEQL